MAAWTLALVDAFQSGEAHRFYVLAKVAFERIFQLDENYLIEDF